MAVKLSARMSALAALVTPGARLADVGTDHGYIPVFLCQTGAIPSAIAMDINCGPLRRAEAHVAEYGLEDRIETRLSDGLEKLRSGEADCVLIAGMGGSLMQRILSDGKDVLQSVTELILQPQSEVPRIRRFLREAGYRIIDEDMVEEDGKFYFIIKAHKAESDEEEPKSSSERQRLEDEFGPVLLRKRHPVLLRWIRRELGIAAMINRKIMSSAVPDAGSGEIFQFRHGEIVRQEKLKKRLEDLGERWELLQEGLGMLEENASAGKD